MADAALRLYARAMEIGAADADVYVNAGAMWARKGDARRARELWGKALVIDPGNGRARVNLERLGGERSNRRTGERAVKD